MGMTFYSRYREMNESKSDLARQNHEQVRRQYAWLAASGSQVSKREDSIARGRAEFDEFCKLPFVQQLGVDVGNGQVVVGTTCAYLRKTKEEPWRIIGEFIVTMKWMPAGFCCYNNTSTVGGFHHPHVNTDGTMCISNRQEILLLLADGNFLEAFKIIWTALNTTNGVPYPDAAPDKWPELRPDLKEEA